MLLVNDGLLMNVEDGKIGFWNFGLYDDARLLRMPVKLFQGAKNQL
jgi:hypothetical protein